MSSDLVQTVGDQLRAGGPASTTERLVEICLAEGLSVRQAYQLVGRAKVQLRKLVDANDRPDEMAAQLQRLEHVFAGACEAGDWSAAVKAIQATNTMLGLKP